MTSTNSYLVGFTSVVLLGYTLILLGIHAVIPHPSVTKKVISLSHLSLALLALAQACIVATYFIPHISGACICGGLWAASLVFYVVGLYSLKFVYVQRISILNKHPMLASPAIAKWIRIITVSLCTSCVVCLIMMMVLTDGECHEDLTEYGCKPTFHDADVYLAIVMISIDACLFGGFCYKWWGLIRVFKLANDSKMLIEMVRSFGIQFVLTALAMLSCIIDGVINIWYPNYSTLIIYCIDCAVIASCDFAMIKESQGFMWKYICWPCRLPSIAMKGNGLNAVKSQTKTANPEITASEPSGPTTIKSSSSKASMMTNTTTTVAEPNATIQLPAGADGGNGGVDEVPPTSPHIITAPSTVSEIAPDADADGDAHRNDPPSVDHTIPEVNVVR